MVSEAKVVEALVCGTSYSGFKSRQIPLNGRCRCRRSLLEEYGRQLVLKTRIQQTVGVPYGKQATIPPSSSFPPEAEK